MTAPNSPYVPSACYETPVPPAIGPAPTPQTNTLARLNADPATLRVLNWPHPALRTRAEEIPAITQNIRDVAERMIELMREHEGIGLAAPQVGLPWRLFVAHVPHHSDAEPDTDPDAPDHTNLPLIAINPVITSLEGPPEPMEEGCLSLPDINGDVRRPPIVTISALNPASKPFTLRASGLLARCIQHEIDHLDATLIIDRFSQITRLKVRAALKDLERAAKNAARERA